MRTKCWKWCALIPAFGLEFCSLALPLAAVQFVELDNYHNPSTGLYEVNYIPPTLLHPNTNIMAGGSSSGVAIAPNWVLRQDHALGQIGTIQRIDGVDYKIAETHTFGGNTIGIARITKMNGDLANLTKYASIDPHMIALPGSVITQGGFGSVYNLDADGDIVAIGGMLQGGEGVLRWGRNIVTQADSSTVSYTFQSAQSEESEEEIDFEGYGAGGDSGGGYFIRDGWDWRLVGSTHGPGYADTISLDRYNWIKDTITNNGNNPSAFPSLPSASKPAATTTYTGFNNGSWNTAGNWSSVAVPKYERHLYDDVSISGNGFNNPLIGSGTTAKARDLLIGRTSSTAAKLTLASGGSLDTLSVFVGGASGEYGVFNMTGGSLSSETEYVGLHGRGTVNHTGGVNKTSRLVVGKDNSAASTSSFYFLGGYSLSSVPTVDATLLIIGNDHNSTGSVVLFGDSNVELNTTMAVVGHQGIGEFDHQIGTHTVAGDLIIGNTADSIGTYALLGTSDLSTIRTIVGVEGTGHFYQYESSTHTTNELIIDDGSDYTIGNGDLIARRIDGLVAFDAVPGNGKIVVDGLTDFREASFANPLNGTLELLDESLLLISSTLPEFGNVTPTDALEPHLVGTPLEISDGGFRGYGEITDEIAVGEDGYIKVSGPAPVSLRELRLADSLTLQSNSYVNIEEDAFLRINGGLLVPSGVVQIQNEGQIVLQNADASVDLGATLTVSGLLEFKGGSRTFSIDGTLDVGPSIETLVLKTSSAPPADTLAIQFGDDSVTQIELTLDAGNDFISGSESAVTIELGGQLNLTRIDDFVPNIGDVYDIVVNTGSITDIFETIAGGVIDFSTPTNQDDIGLAVFYANDGGLNKVMLRPSLLGDANMDNVVNNADLNIVSNNFFESGMSWETGDFNGDGVVNNSDYSIVLNNFFLEWPGSGGLSVPEPTGLMLVSLGLTGFFILPARRPV